MSSSPSPTPFSRGSWRAKKDWHAAQARLPVEEKVRILLELQKQDLPLIEAQRPLKPWERPWAIEP